MRIGNAHLTYCTNIHPGESWEEVRESVESHVTRVRERLAPDQPFGVGLRLSAQAAERLADPETLDAFRSLLAERGLYVFTINGFPYGAFHGTRVKEQVYRPDWLEDERLRYSDMLAGILARLLPPAVDGSVSSVPGCFRPRATGQRERDAIAERIVRHVATLVRLRREQGRRIALALEPEPRCVIETTAEAVAFFEQSLFGPRAVAQLEALTSLTRLECEAALREHLGVCVDACHAAVEFEEPAAVVGALRSAGIAIAKLQVSAGLRVAPPDVAARVALQAFAEDVYLHQVVARVDGGLRRYQDLPEALGDSEAARASEWRVHFHVPLFLERLGAFENTQGFVAELLALQRRDGIAPHLEVETYTWSVLPVEFRGEDVVDSVVRELRFVLDRLAGS